MRSRHVITLALVTAVCLFLLACAAPPAASPTAAPAPTAPPKPAAPTAAPAAPTTAPAAPTAAPATAAPAAAPAATKPAAAANEAAAKIENFDQKFADLIAKAKQEGTMMLYHTTVPEPTARYVEKFQQRFPGVKVERFRAVAGPLHERFRTEARSGRPVADVIYSSTVKLMQDLINEKLIAGYTPAAAPAYPPAMKIEGYAYPLYAIRFGIAYNTDLVKEADAEKLKTWEGLLDPKFKGSIVLINPAAASSQFVVYHYFRERLGRSFLEKLAAQNPVILNSAGPSTERVAAGEFAVVGATVDEAFDPVFDKGAPVRLVWPPPSPLGPQMVAVTANAPHPNAAKLYLEWSMSAEGQAVHAETHGPSVLSSIPQPARKATSAPWWKNPSSIYVLPPGAEEQFNTIIDEWKQIFKVQ